MREPIRRQLWKRQFVTHSSRYKKAFQALQGHTRKHQGPSGERRRREKHGQRAFTVVFLGRNGQDRVSKPGLGLATFNNSSELSVMGTVPSSLEPGPGVMREGQIWARV